MLERFRVQRHLDSPCARFFAAYPRRNGRCCLESSKLGGLRRFVSERNRLARPTYCMRALPRLRASAVAAVTILAMLIVPACGSLCAAMHHCSSSAMATDAEDCHHAGMSAQPDSVAVSSLASCGQQLPLLAILTVPELSAQIQSLAATDAPVPIDVSNHIFALNSRFNPFVFLHQAPQQSVPLEKFSVLRN